ncbi:MAG: hypothetical protein CL610_19675 [Anaerolineaceae bacterium]|nr:hypothetical protein [Anaerolineaceae bacterium]
MSTNADSLIREAISVYREGKKDQARTLLLQAVDLDERSEEAWLWLSAVVDTPEDQITCLENVLTINPDNAKAQQGLTILNEKLNAPPVMPSTPAVPSAAFAAEPEEDDDPFANVSFTEQTPTTAQSPFVDAPEVDEELPDSGVWDSIATSSASAVPAAPEPAPEVYNDWIAGLNIGTNEAGEAFGVDDSDLFDEGPFTGGEPFELDKDIFSQVDDDEEFLTTDAGPFSTSPFTADLDFDEDEDEDDEAPAAAASFPPPVARPAPRETTSIPLQSPAPRAADPMLSSFDVDDDFDDIDLYDDYDDNDLVSVDPSEFFRFIPAEIKASRLPGTRERYPTAIILSLMLLFVLNIGAVALVFLTLSNGG